MGLTELTEGEYRQLSMFEDTKRREKQKKIDETMDDIRRQFGNGMIVRGSTLNTAGKVAKKAKAQMENTKGKNIDKPKGPAH